MAENPNFGIDQESVAAILNRPAGESAPPLPGVINQAAINRLAKPVFSHENQCVVKSTPREVVQHRNAHLSG